MTLKKGVPLHYNIETVLVRYLLDTNIISEPARPEPNSRVIQQLQRYGHEAAITSISWHELLYGLERMPEGRKRTYLAEFITQVVRPAFPILSYEESAAQWHARERARLASIGRTAGFADGQIASIAVTANLILVTRNLTDFNGFEGLHLENWFAA